MTVRTTANDSRATLTYLCDSSSLRFLIFTSLPHCLPGALTILSWYCRLLVQVPPIKMAESTQDQLSAYITMCRRWTYENDRQNVHATYMLLKVFCTVVQGQCHDDESEDIAVEDFYRKAQVACDNWSKVGATFIPLNPSTAPQRDPSNQKPQATSSVKRPSKKSAPNLQPAAGRAVVTNAACSNGRKAKSMPRG